MWTGRCVEKLVVSDGAGSRDSINRLLDGMQEHLLGTEELTATWADYFKLLKAGKDLTKSERPRHIEIHWVTGNSQPAAAPVQPE
jgi:hypothetical protein